ncbi:MAG: DNA mismatch repair protein MutS [Ruminococcus sp.]|nr:DNA mismatch repair protein MutS [Ruminococcus sp.]
MAFIIIALLLAAAFVVMIYDHLRYKKRIELILRNSYGKPRENMEERRERLGDAARLFVHDSQGLSEADIVDDITWNDLGMDEVFLSADHTDSYAGEQFMYSAMRRLDTDISELSERDRRSEYFDKNEDKRLEVRKILYRLGQIPSGFTLIDSISNIGNDHLRYRKLFPVLGVFLLILGVAAALTRLPILLFLVMVVLIVNLILHTLVKGAMLMHMQTIFNAAAVINTAKALSEAVPEMSGDVKSDLDSLSVVMKRSFYLTAEQNADASGDTLMKLLFGFMDIFMTDLICYERVIDALSDKTDELMRVFRFTGSIDHCIAMASYRRYSEDTCIPEFTSELNMRMEGVYHPLIRNAVRNDMEYKRNTIITGSNASGKSTFIKSAALALIMGQTLHICHAESAVIPRCGVMTSMAVSDDILSGESYYIREIRYLKRMVELCSGKKPMFLAVDEILRGTNTKERIAASKAVLEYFSEQNCMVIVATHDMELAEYFSHSCDNFHFCETVEEGDVVFDYKLHSGISTTSNAIRLLSVMGFPEDIVSSAENYTEMQ